MNNEIIIASALDGYSRRKDGSCTLRFATTELSTAQITDIDKLYNRYGVLYFCDKEVMNAKEIQMLRDIDVDKFEQPKSKAQRLRNVLYLIWKQDIEAKGIDYDTFYSQEYEKIIEHYKNKIVK